MVGHALALSPTGDTEAHATAWASPDGVTWTRADDSEDLTLGGCAEADPRQDCGGMTAVAATPSGFVAVGYRYEGGSTQSPAAWTSPDGLTWTLTMAGLDFEGGLDSVAVGPVGVVAGGLACAAKQLLRHERRPRVGRHLDRVARHRPGDGLPRSPRSDRRHVLRPRPGWLRTRALAL